MFDTGLVVGKFYPPHRGHSYLIETARAQTRHLTVLVCNHPLQSIPGRLRGEWLRDVHPDVDVRVIPDDLPDDDSQAWAANCLRILGYAPDAVFTSEDYGDAFARFLGSRHILVDRARIAVPCSGTAIRANPFDNWEFIAPPVRAYFTRRVCVLGAESTGTTTMAKALAGHYQTEWVPEYGREYWAKKMLRPNPDAWSTDEFIHIAVEQCRREDEAARLANKVLICDTDAFATSLWHERYIGFISPEVDAVSQGRRYDAYFLTDVDIPFVQDGYRDGEHIRTAMHQRFIDEMNRRRIPFILLSGSRDKRLRKAISVVDHLTE